MNVELDKEAKRLVLEHLGEEWQVQWSERMTRAAGLCWGSRKLIKLSIPIMEKMTDDQRRLTILHEIAHGLAGCEHYHDGYWRSICLKIGGDGKRCYGPRLTPRRPSTHRYVYECPICGRRQTTRRKLGNNMYCRPCWNSHYDPEPLQLVDSYDVHPAGWLPQ